MKKAYLLILFLVINFGGLALGSWLMDGGPTSDWYNNLQQAPWTPPGWVFGAAWTLIMICFSWYLTTLFSLKVSTGMVLLYTFQVLLNVSWNWFFFNQHWTSIGLIVINILTIIIFTFFFAFTFKPIKIYRTLLLPYMIWLCIATSLNAYVVIYN
ncbi:TspO/MBR family protein [Winogradskyella aurantiaca]|uniref:TspO/MBR family protein n=1 Tax=Winogradskyella aurantiaca TaxID=2219558 RepID=UPI000E1DD2E9|nr:TspO/MBR family protein [Winogradskyella aurantiaca]